MPAFTYTALASVHRMINSSSDEQDNVVSVRGLEVVRGCTRVLCGIDMDILAGQIVGLLGPSG